MSSTLQSSSLAALQRQQEVRLLKLAILAAFSLHFLILCFIFISKLRNEQKPQTQSAPPTPTPLTISINLDKAQPLLTEPELKKIAPPPPPPKPVLTRMSTLTDAPAPLESFIQSSRNARAGTNKAELEQNQNRLALDGSQEQSANAFESQRLTGQNPKTTQNSPTNQQQNSPNKQQNQLANSPDKPINLPKSELLKPVKLISKTETQSPNQNSVKQIERKAQTMTGQLRIDGTSQFDTEATPLGIYMEEVGKAVTASWQDAIAKRRGNAGSLRLRFRVRPSGESTNFEFIGLRDAGSVAEDITLEALLNAKLPPIPEEVLQELKTNWLECEYDFLF